jgi:hypothetical protein
VSVFSKKNIKLTVTRYVPMLLGLRIPGFIKIHLRYMRRNLIIWLVLVIAPFILGLMSLSLLNRNLPDVSLTGWQRFFIVLLCIAAAFYFAERHRKFRRFYVMAIPGMVLINGFFRFVILGGISIGGIVTFAILAGLPAWLLGRLSLGAGYRMLSNGADKDYRPGRDLYMEGQYALAFAHLEPSAERGHMKSLYLLGHALEHGNGFKVERVRAAQFYNKSAQKGYRKAHGAFEALFASFTSAEVEAFEADLNISGDHDLF